MRPIKQEIHEKEIKKLIQKYNNVNETIKISDAEIKNKKLKIEKLEKIVINLQIKRKKEYTNNLKALINEIKNQETKKEEYTNNLKALINEIENQETKKEEYTNNLKALKNNVLELKGKKKEKETKSLIKNLQNKINENEKYIKNLDNEIKNQKAENEKYQKKLETLTNEIQNQVEKKQTFEQKIKKLENNILNFKKNQNELENQLVKIEELSTINYQIINFKGIVQIEQLIKNIDLQRQKILKQSEQSLKIQESIQNDQKILNLCFIIIELKNNKNAFNNSINIELEASITTPAVENNVNPKENKKSWSIRGFFKPVTNFIWDKKQKLTINYYQKQEKRLAAEIRKLEAGKIKDFWNKFWLVISCGCYNNHGKVERKIKKRELELAEVKKQLAKFNVVVNNKNNDNEPQPSTSSAITDEIKTWSDETKVAVENISFLEQNSTSSKLGL